MTTASYYRLHTDADEATLKEIADHINTCYPHLRVYIYPIERDDEEQHIKGDHGDACECGQCTGEDRALEQMEKGIAEAERNYGDD